MERKWIAQDHLLRPGVTEPPQGWVEDERIGRVDRIEDSLPFAKTA